MDILLKKRLRDVNVSELKLAEIVVDTGRVVKVTKGGRRFKFRALVVVGNEEGIVGFGAGKAREVSLAIQKAIERARKNLFRVPIINGTVPHDIEYKFKATHIIIKPCTPGTGIVAGGAMRAVFQLAGYTDVIAKCVGSPNPYNVVRATIKALVSMRDAYTVARERGITLQKLFHG